MFTAGLAVIATADATHPSVENMTDDEKKFLGIPLSAIDSESE
jgi:hypothetical protein